jgi:stress-induced morphogen
MGDRIERIDAALRAAFSPTELQIKDQTHLHAGHAGAQSGLGHFEVRIAADAFAGKNPIERHRMVYDALGDLMLTDIHALKIRATAPDEG